MNLPTTQFNCRCTVIPVQPPPHDALPVIDHVELQQRVCELLEWDQSGLSSYMYENGRAYIKALLGDAPDLVDKLERSKAFWDWFKRLYYRLDSGLVGKTWEALNCENREMVYRMVHTPHTLAFEFKPNRVVWDLIDQGL